MRIAYVAALSLIVALGCESGGGPARDAASHADAAGDEHADAHDADASAICELTNNYAFYDTASEPLPDPPVTQTELRAPNTCLYERQLPAGGDVSAEACIHLVPCASGSSVTVSAIAAALANADVQAALAKPPGMMYGSDPRPSGTVWVFQRADGRGFTLGTGDVPVGLAALHSLLEQVTAQALASSDCDSARP